MNLIVSKINETDLVLCRVLETVGEIAIPAGLRDEAGAEYRIAELAPYAFSEHALPADIPLFLFDAEEASLKDGTLCGRFRRLPGDAEGERSAHLSEEVTGAKLRTLCLPRSLKKIGRYAFYNCENLSALSVHSAALDLGQGCFTGCGAIRKLEVFVDEKRRSPLQEILSELRYPILLSYYYDPGEEKGDPEKTGGAYLKYRLLFPEFYENADENTPARITVRDLHGSGLMYRNCFADTQFQPSRYDALFPYAVALESEETGAELALCRLEVPTALQEEQKKRYEAFLSAHPDAFFAALLRHYQDGIVSAAGIRTLFSSWIGAASADGIRELLSGLIGAAAKETESENTALRHLLMDLYADTAADTVPDPKERSRHFEL